MDTVNALECNGGLNTGPSGRGGTYAVLRSHHTWLPDYLAPLKTMCSSVPGMRTKNAETFDNIVFRVSSVLFSTTIIINMHVR